MVQPEILEMQTQLVDALAAKDMPRKAGLVEIRQDTHGDPLVTLALATEASELLLGEPISNNALRKWDPVLKHCLIMICAKLARASQGNQYFEDHWADIKGYAEIALRRVDRLETS